jgi:cobalamin biosynthesis protein CobD/CbiB
MDIFKNIWGKISEFVEKTYTDRKTGENFLGFVFILGGIGVFFCIMWFIGLCMQGIPLGYLIFDIAIILFCAWAIIWCIVPMAKDAFKQLEESDCKDKDKTDKI